MKRFLAMAASVALLLTLGAPAALAAGPEPNNRSVLLSVNGVVDVAAGEHVDALVVIDGTARVSGDVRTVVVLGGSATLTGATAESVVVVDGSVDLQGGTTVSGDVRTIGGTVTQEPGATVGGTVRSLDTDMAALGVLLIPAFILLFLGFGLAAVAAALLVAAFAARQVRQAESLIGRQPGQTLAAGIAGTVLLPLIAVLLIMTIVGAPIGFGLLFVLLPAIAFLAWIVAAIWIGDWLVARFRGAPEPDRPYRAALVGVLALATIGLLPFVTAIATLFGFGALLLLAWRTLRREGQATAEAGPAVTPAGPAVTPA